MTNKQYNEYIEKHAKKSPSVKNCIKAFLVGGTFSLLAEIFLNVCIYCRIEKDIAIILSSIFLILLSSVLTGIGVFDKIAKFGGGGALVPITGFSNSVTSPAIESKSEGYITGVASKMFTIAGPVIVYGTASSIIYGIIYWALMNTNII